MEVSEWVGRLVRRTDSNEDAVLGPAIVLAVDDTAYAPSAWIKYRTKDDGGKREYPSYRSIDLSDLEDIETGEGGPRWGIVSQRERTGNQRPALIVVPAKPTSRVVFSFTISEKYATEIDTGEVAPRVFSGPFVTDSRG